MRAKRLVGKNVLVIRGINGVGIIGQLQYDHSGYFSVGKASFEPDEIKKVERGNPPVIILEG